MRGRPRNPTLPRSLAREHGAALYTMPPCPDCGCTERYVSNGQCQDCAKRRARLRYASLTAAELADLKARDRDRYYERRNRTPNQAPRKQAIADLNVPEDLNVPGDLATDYDPLDPGFA